MDQIYIPTIKYKVLVSCVTYNHSKYIEKALNGFVMQETNFPFICRVVDDCSTDGAIEVIKKWMVNECDMDKAEYIDLELSTLILVPHKLNKNCNFAFYYLKRNLYGNPVKFQLILPWEKLSEYKATCEGDDYWIDPLKLQKQVDALDNNPNTIMVYTNYKTVNDSGNYILRPEYEYYKKLSHSGNILPELFTTNFPLTCTMLIRTSIYESEIYNNAPCTLDFLTFMTAAFLGDCYYITEETSCYRLNPDSAMSTSRSNVTLRNIRLEEYFSVLYAEKNCKKENFLDSIRTKYQISKKYVSFVPHKKTIFKRLIKADKSFIIFIPIIVIAKIIEKLKFHR